MRHRWTPCLLAGLTATIAGLMVACGDPEATARGLLLEDGYFDIELTRAGDSGVFDFKAKKKPGLTCMGSIGVSGGIGSSSTTVSNVCFEGDGPRPAPEVVSEPEPPPAAGFARAVDYARESGRTDAADVASEDDPVSLAARGTVQALLAADRGWLSSNAVPGFRLLLNDDTITSMILFLRELGGGLRLGPPELVSADAVKQIYEFDLKHAGGAGHKPLTFKLELGGPALRGLFVEGEGFKAELEALKKMPRVLTSLGSYTKTDTDGVLPGPATQGAPGLRVMFATGGLTLKKDMSRVSVKFDIENIDDDTHEKLTMATEDRDPGFLTVMVNLPTKPPGNYVVHADITDVHASKSLKLSHPLKIVAPAP